MTLYQEAELDEYLYQHNAVYHANRELVRGLVEAEVLVPVEMGHVFTVGDPWDNEVWLPSLFPKGTRVAVIRIGDDE